MNREQFFADCASSYPKALLAISHFRDYVREECRRELKKHLTEISLAVGLPPDEVEIVKYAEPDQLTPANPDNLYLGAKGKRADGTECVWAYIYWERDSQETPFKYGVGFDVWPANRDEFRAAMDAAVEKPPFGDDEWWCWDGEGEVSCYVELEENRLASFAPELDRLIARVTEVVRSIENVALFFRK
jgi:hypothetical protein